MATSYMEHKIFSVPFKFTTIEVRPFGFWTFYFLMFVTSPPTLSFLNGSKMLHVDFRNCLNHTKIIQELLIGVSSYGVRSGGNSLFFLGKNTNKFLTYYNYINSLLNILIMLI